MPDKSADQIKALTGQLTRYGLLSEALLLIAETPDLERLLFGATNKLKWVLDFERCTLALINQDGVSFALRTLLETRRDVAKIEAPDVPLENGLSGEVIRTKRMRLISDLSAERDGLPPAADPAIEDGSLSTVLALPLKAYDKILGCLTFCSSKNDAFSREDIKIAVAFATHLGLAVDRGQQSEVVRRAHEAMRDSEERYALAMQGSNDGLWDWDLRTDDIHVSARLKTLIGLDASEERVTPELWQSRIHPSDLAQVLAAFRAHLRGDTEFFSIEFRTLPEDGQYRWVLQRGYALREEDGRAYRMAGSLGDISDRKHAEFELLEAKDRAESALADLKEAQANLVHAEKMASLGQLTAGIAHEIKNPLNFINNFAQTSIELLEELQEVSEPGIATLQEDERDDAADIFKTLATDLDTIVKHGQRADGIVKNMLLHSRGGANDHEPTDVNALVEESLNLAYHGERARDSEFNIKIEHNFDPDAGAVDLLPQEISRVLVNLFGNGFYATRSRKKMNDSDYEPAISVTTRSYGDAVEILIRDNGTGMPKEVRDKLFTPFFTTKPTGEGTGLGLSLSYDIITQQHKGTIDAKSEENGFTEFTIRLPRQFGETPQLKNE
jgi:two-component system NtrC family sensor kinase